MRANLRNSKLLNGIFFYASCNLECKLGNLLIQSFLTKKWNIFFLTVDNR